MQLEEGLLDSFAVPDCISSDSDPFDKISSNESVKSIHRVASAMEDEGPAGWAMESVEKLNLFVQLNAA